MTTTNPYAGKTKEELMKLYSEGCARLGDIEYRIIQHRKDADSTIGQLEMINQAAILVPVPETTSKEATEGLPPV